MFQLIRLGLYLVCLTIASGLSALAEPTFSFQAPGADADLRDNLTAASLLQDEIGSKKTGDPQQLLAAARADYGRIVSALYDQGYFSGVVSIKIDGREAASIPPLSPPTTIRSISVTVQPGGAFVFGRTQIGPVPAGTEVPDDYAPGKPARTGVIKDAAKTVVEGWRQMGHARAYVGEQSVVADHNQKQLNVALGIAPGPVVTFGKFLISGNQRVSDERIRDIAGYPLGQIYSPEALARSAKRLRQTGTFRSVSVQEAKDINPDNTLDIETTLIEEKRRRLGYGAEVSTVEGATLSAFWIHRNLLGGAERLRFDAKVSGIGDSTGGIDYSVGARLTRPGTFTPTTGLYIEALAERKDEPDYTSTTGLLGFGFTKTVSDTLEAEAGLRYRFSKVTEFGTTSDYQLLSLPIKASWDTRDNALDATKGFYVSTGIEPFLGLGGTASGARIIGDARAYRQVGERFTFAVRGQVGSIVGASATDVPPDFRFYSGGGGTVRGHSYQSLGIDLGGGSRSGGGSLAVLSLEARAKITEKIGLVGFFDYGYVGANSFPDSTGGSHSGAGLGLRYNTGIGPIRLDVATPVSGAGVGSNIQIYVGIGQSF